MQKFLKRKEAVPEVETEFNRQLKKWKTESSFNDTVPLEAEVEAIQFGLLSEEEIKGLSAVEITQPHTQKTNVIQRGGATDARLGTANRSMLCLTCGCSSNECGVGHSGHLELRYPVPNGEYLKTLHKILECICVNCCRLRIPKDFDRYESIVTTPNPKDRLKRIHNVCRKRLVCESFQETSRKRKFAARAKRVGYEQALLEEEDVEFKEDLPVEELLAQGTGCGAIQPTWIMEDGVFLRPLYTLTDEEKAKYDRGEYTPIVFTPNDIIYMLSNIPREDVEILGMNFEHSHPVNLMWRSLYIPTINIRPSKIGRQGNNRSANEDDLTTRLKNIVRCNLLLQTRLKQQEKKGSDSVVNLAKFKYNTSGECNSAEAAFKNDRGTLPKKQVVTSLVLYERLYITSITYQNHKLKKKGTIQFGKVRASLRTKHDGQKKNRIRGNVMGKRMNFTARSVASPNPVIHIHDVETPLMIAMHLTYPERVTRYNIHRLSNMVRRGPHVYPGARYVITSGNKMEDLDSELRFSIRLEIGMVVERHMLDGDYVLMNRQPSLHRHSIMAHRAVINLDPHVKSFGLHLAVTTAYNADFDGDEMNMMLLQGEMQRAEAHCIMLVDEMILLDDVAIVGFVQNAPVSAYMLTKETSKISKTDAGQMLMQHCQFQRIPWDEFGDKPFYSGHEVFSCILPVDFSMESGEILIKDGVMLRGRWIKSTLRHLIHQMFRDYGSTFTADFITGTYNMLNWYATSVQGFTVAMDDVYVPSAVLGLDDISARCSEYFGKFPKHSVQGKSMESSIVERNLCSVTDRIMSVVGHRAIRYFKANPHQNGMMDMTTSGAKGDVKNVVQVSGLIGQQYNHRSIRFPQTTCHFTHPDTDQAKAHGMVYSNFTLGMDAIEFFNHLRCSRSGLVDTAVKTARTGYMQRRMAKSLEDITVDLRGNVVNNQGEVLQERYGHDGFLPNELERDTVRLFENDWKQHFTPSEILVVEPMRNALLKSLRVHRNVASMKSIHTPVNMTRMLSRFKRQIQSNTATILAWRTSIWNRLGFYMHENIKLRAYMWEKLSVKNLSAVDLNALEGVIMKRFAKAFVPNGELVGEQSAQSIGEPMTQITLNTFHVAGSASTLTTGIPRVDEVINASSKLATPSNNVFFKLPKTEEEAIAHGHSLVYHSLKNYIVGYEVNPDREYYQDFIEQEEQKIEEENEEEEDNEEEKEEDDENVEDDLRVLQHAEDSQSVFHESEQNFLVIIHLKDTLTTPLSRICNRAKTHLKMESFKWFHGPTFIGVAGSMQDPKLVKWINSMDLNGFDVKLLANLLLEHYGNVHASGIRNIQDFCVCKLDVPEIKDDVIGTKEVFYLTTQGAPGQRANLKHILQLPWVSSTYSTTNSVLEIEDIFGIDAARASIQHELMTVMASSGASVKHRYVALLSERMTMSGHVMATTYNGICTAGTSILRNASFENTMDQFLIGGLRGSKDECKGMTQCVIMNRELQGGTGLVDLSIPAEIPVPPVQKLKYQVPCIPEPGDVWRKKFLTPNTPVSVPSVIANGKEYTSATRRRNRALQTDKNQKSSRTATKRKEPLKIIKPNVCAAVSTQSLLKLGSSSFVPFDIRAERVSSGHMLKPSHLAFMPFTIASAPK